MQRLGRKDLTAWIWTVSGILWKIAHLNAKNDVQGLRVVVYSRIGILTGHATCKLKVHICDKVQPKKT
jgi:hypothetical protein